jgi:hypothetical protein
MRVRVAVTVDIDVDSWADEYGGVSGNQVRGDVRQVLASVVHQHLTDRGLGEVVDR